VPKALNILEMVDAVLALFLESYTELSAEKLLKKYDIF
jgi:hypothetical protein